MNTTNNTGNLEIIRPKWKAQPQNSHESPIETIRRLRIQNKKLLALVACLKAELKNRTLEKNKAEAQLKKLNKINDMLAGIIDSCISSNGSDPDCSHCQENAARLKKCPKPQGFNLNILKALQELIINNIIVTND